MKPLTDFQKTEVMEKALSDLAYLGDEKLGDVLNMLSLVYLDRIIKYFGGHKNRKVKTGSGKGRSAPGI